MGAPHILILEDNRNVAESLRESLCSEGYVVGLAQDAAQARRQTQDRVPDLLLLDIGLSGAHQGGLDFLRELRPRAPRLPVVVVSGKDTTENLLEAGRLGVVQFLSKSDLNETMLLDTVRKALDAARPDPADERRGVGRLLGSSLPMRRLREQILNYAPLDMPVMISGETGSGKELVAKALHEEAPGRADRPLTIVNCAAIPESIIESHLFGHRKGAFTGAIHDHPGIIQQAEGSTLFLDEVGELSHDAQKRLLRFLESGEVQAVGQTDYTHVRARVVTASHQNLSQRALEGRFRPDLRFRLDVLKLNLPSLRERREDVEELAHVFLDAVARRNNLPTRSLSRAALGLLQDHDWPGNVRELRNLMDGLLAGSRHPVVDVDEIRPLLSTIHDHGHAGPWDGAWPGGASTDSVGFLPQSVEEIQPLRQWRQDIQREYIQQVLRLCQGNVTRCAELLAVDRTTIYALIGQNRDS
ncbi:MAG: sigma-54 dependent transcriptional regulator [bacterium]|jgi:two-component system nitrogen regulation response regulator GlnG|nr:sigma-54 dependent transcriptional regulator [bacterium]